MSNRTTTSITSLLLASGCLAFPAVAQQVVQVQEHVSAPQVDEDRFVELCICLDTSGSMDGLINSARQKLWAIVNDLALADPTPTLRVALLTYGNDGHPAENGWVHVQTPFTEDLDKVSELLFALTTNGGTELVGRVIQTSIQELNWHPSDDTLKMIFVAGNESADQDQESPFRDICRQAISMGVMVNSIYCVYPNDDPSIASGWEEVAKLADGQYATIDQDNGTVIIATPLDDRLIELSTAVNATYLPFGVEGQAGWVNQRVQDSNAVTLNKAAAAQRAQTKAGVLYACSWDLVDACRLQQVKLSEVKFEDLPENMQGMTPEEREAFVKDTYDKRQAIQKQIQDLNARRQSFIIAEQTRQAERGVDGFDLAIRGAIRDQARSRGFQFQETEVAQTDQDGEALPYFVKIGQHWVAASFIDDYEAMARTNRGPRFDQTILRNTDGWNTLAATLDEQLRAAAESVEGSLVLQANGKTYLIMPDC